MIGIAFDCGACVETSPDQTVQDVSDDHYATCRLCLNEEEQDHVDSLHAHRTAEEIDVRCGQYFRAIDRQERVKANPDYELPISGDIISKLRRNQ